MLLICGYPLAHWKREELWWGAHSLTEMTQSLVRPSLYQLDPRFLHQRWYKITGYLRPWLLPALAILCVCQLLSTSLDGSWLKDARTRWLGRFGVVLAGIVMLSMLASWLAFLFLELPLPLGRTGIYLLPLSTLIAGIVAAVPPRSLVSQWLSRCITALFICVASYFVLCLRLNYFFEYEWNADVKDVYSVLALLNRSRRFTEVGVTNGLYLPSLNYYRVLSRNETFPTFKPAPTTPLEINVMDGATDLAFIKKNGLVVIYRGKTTDVVVAVRPSGPIPPVMIDP